MLDVPEIIKSLQLEDSECQELGWKPAVTVIENWKNSFTPSRHTGWVKWPHGNFLWHAFSMKAVPCLSGPSAEAAYNTCAERAFHVMVLGVDEQLVIEVLKGRLCDLDSIARTQYSHLGANDLYIFPTDYSWTYVSTHEIEMGLGPYFARAVI